MSKKLSKPSRRGRRTVVFASLAAVAAMLVASVGAAPAQGDEVGTTSARGTAQAGVALLAGPHNVDVQYSAITNCIFT
jgi:nitrous oxide reductase